MADQQKEIVSLLIHPPIVRATASEDRDSFVLGFSVDTPHGPISGQSVVPRKLVLAQCARANAILSFLCKAADASKGEIVGQMSGAEILGTIHVGGDEVSGPPIEGDLSGDEAGDESGDEAGFSLKKQLRKAKKAARRVAAVRPSVARVLQTIPNARDPFTAANKAINAARHLGSQYIPGTKIPLGELSPIFKADQMARKALGSRYNEAVTNIARRAIPKIDPSALHGYAAQMARSMGEDLATQVIVSGGANTSLPKVRVRREHAAPVDQGLHILRLYSKGDARAAAYLTRLRDRAASGDKKAMQAWHAIARISEIVRDAAPAFAAGAEGDRGYAVGYGEPTSGDDSPYRIAMLGE